MDILDQMETAGEKEVSVNLGQIASGVYFYKLTFDNMEATKKMVIVR